MTPITERLAERLFIERDVNGQYEVHRGDPRPDGFYKHGSTVAEYRLRTHPAEGGEGRDYVLVPREPTPEMCRAGFLSGSEGFDIETPADAPSLVYRAMIAAAPPAQPVAPAPTFRDPTIEDVRNLRDELPIGFNNEVDWASVMLAALNAIGAKVEEKS